MTTCIRLLQFLIGLALTVEFRHARFVNSTSGNQSPSIQDHNDDNDDGMLLNRDHNLYKSYFISKMLSS